MQRGCFSSAMDTYLQTSFKQKTAPPQKNMEAWPCIGPDHREWFQVGIKQQWKLWQESHKIVNKKAKVLLWQTQEMFAKCPAVWCKIFVK